MIIKTGMETQYDYKIFDQTCNFFGILNFWQIKLLSVLILNIVTRMNKTAFGMRDKINRKNNVVNIRIVLSILKPH